MHRTSKLLSAACALALTACAARQPVPYSPPPRPVIDPLPPDLVLTEKDREWCPTMLRLFSASSQTISDLCSDMPGSSSASKPAAP